MTRRTEQLKIQGIHTWFLEYDVAPEQALWRLAQTDLSYNRARELLNEWTRERNERSNHSIGKGEVG